MQKPSPCGHEWTISLISQKTEMQLDQRLKHILNATFDVGTHFSFFFNKSFSLKQLPKLVFNSDDDDYFIPADVDSCTNLMNSLKALKNEMQIFHSKEAIYYLVRHQTNVVGFLKTELNHKLKSVEQILIHHLLNVYCHQAATLSYSQVDPLSQLLNRQTFEEKVVEVTTDTDNGLCIHAKPHGHWFLAMVDIDHFKSVNDTYGHVIGDEVIVLIAQLFQKSFREDDYVFRYGGEEFAIVFPAHTEDEAFIILDRVRDVVENTVFPQVQTITISLGFIELEKNRLIPELVNDADLALYHSKESGRNKVTAYSVLNIEKQNYESNDIELF